MSDSNTKEPSRRDFIYVATAAAGAVTGAAAIWPLIDQMNPSADVQALSSIEVDVADVEPGSQITVKWLGKPVFIRRRTQEEIDEARSVDISTLPDPSSFNENKPDTDANDINRTLDESGEWLVMVVVCTQLGCVPLSDWRLQWLVLSLSWFIMILLVELGRDLHQRTCPYLQQNLLKI